MNRKILIIMLVAVFLITSVGVVSADKDTIDVKVVWDGVDDIPDFVVVDLIKDGKVVDTATLNAKNSWKTTFKVDENESYQVKEKISDNYSYEITENEESEFVIHNKLVENAVIDDSEDVLSSPVEEPAIEEGLVDDVMSDADKDVISEVNDSLLTEDSQSGGNCATDSNGVAVDEGSSNATDNSTDNSTEDSNATDNSTADSASQEDSADDTTVDKSSKDTPKEKKTTTKTKTTTTTKIIKQTKKPVNATTDHKNTGFPIVVLIIALIVVIFIPLSRKK